MGISREVIAVLVTLAGTIVFGVLANNTSPNLSPANEQELRRPFVRTGYGKNAYQVRVMFPWANVDIAPEQGSPISVSTVDLFEDGRPLGPGHISFSEIAAKGAGRFIFGQDTQSKFVIFSTSDDSDPNVNGRTYWIKDDALHDPYLR